MVYIDCGLCIERLSDRSGEPDIGSTLSFGGDFETPTRGHLLTISQIGICSEPLRNRRTIGFIHCEALPLHRSPVLKDNDELFKAKKITGVPEWLY